MPRIFIVWLLVIHSSVAIAQSLRLPLDGNYRPGTYIPVDVEASKEVTLQSDGAMNSHATRTGVIPIFTLSANVDHLQAGDKSYPIRALQPDEKLVATTSPNDAAIAKAFFPDAHLIFVSLDPSAPLPGPACAWSSLDMAILDSAPPNLPELLAAGLTIAVRSPDRPDSTWPWQHAGQAWVISANTSPRWPAMLGEDAYLPAESWSPQMSPQRRELIILLAVLIACLMLATTLLQPKFRLPALAGVVVISCIAIELWQIRQPIADTLSGSIRIEQRLPVTDRWIYETSTRPTQIRFELNDVTYPVFASPAHAASLHAIFDADTNTIRCDLPANGTMAFVTRSVGASASNKDDDADRMAILARRAYLTPAAQVDIENNQVVISSVTKR